MTDMLVPEYLSPVAENAVQQDGEITLRLRCPCGCRRFRVEKMAFNVAEQRQADEYDQAVQQVMKKHRIRTRRDEKGLFVVQCKRGLFGRWTPLLELLPPAPAFIDVTGLRAFCRACGQESLLLDSRRHGLGAIMDGNSGPAREWQPTWQPLDIPEEAACLEVNLLYDMPEEEIRELTPAGVAVDVRNAFEMMQLRGVKEDGTSFLLFDAETD